MILLLHQRLQFFFKISSKFRLRKKKLILLFLICGILDTQYCKAQNIDSAFSFSDSNSLQKVTITAFSANAKWKDVPSSVAVITNKTLHRFDASASLVPALNNITGVRMEERSPGSYRLSVRGSLLRSPFGIRNIKIYWNDIPFTDAGGNSYLNLVDLNGLQSAELIKGPAASMYGANTGGALILNSKQLNDFSKENSFNAGVSSGSYGLVNEQLGWQYHTNKFYAALQQSHVQNDGYRRQSSFRRDAVKWNAHWVINKKEQLSVLMFYTDLHYETPGGLTLQQMDSMPTLARQPAGIFPGSEQQQTGVYNKTAFTGFSLKSIIGNCFDNTTSITFNHTDFKNPFITNYEKRNELNYGGRTVFIFHKQSKQFSFHWLNGFEWQQNFSQIDVYGNNAGIVDTVQYKDVLFAKQYYFFSQLNFNAGAKWKFQAGISTNKQNLKYKRTTDILYNNYIRQNTNLLTAPRLSALYNINNSVSAYAIISKGFSPPTLAEVRPSTGTFYNLQPEYGWNFETGLKGFLFKNRFAFDISSYSFKLINAIVRKTDNAGGDYFTNAGGTKQKGIEVWMRTNIITSGKNFIKQLTATNSFSYQPYKFDKYLSGTKDYSGNSVTGVPEKINVFTIDAEINHGFYANLNLNYTSSIPLNDTNTVFAKPYHLIQVKIGKEFTIRNTVINIYAGIDNILNEVYSLGNDINAAGRPARYYNPAPARNYFVGFNIKL